MNTSKRPGDERRLDRPVVPATTRYAASRRAELARATADGTIQRVRRGVYAQAAAPELGPAAARRELVLRRIAAVADRLRTDYWFSHTSAALLHGCWTWRLSDAVHVTQLRAPKGAQSAERDLRRHWTRLPRRDRTEIGGLPVTALERTVVDCARSLDGGQALVVADSAARAGADPDVLAALLDESVGKRGVRRAREVVALADARSESPGESIVRWYAHEAGLPPPVPGLSIATPRGTYWLDLGWPEMRVAIEFDGAVKYSGGAYGDPETRLWNEKLRHDALAEAGWTVIRVVWSDLADSERLIRRLQAAMRRRAWT